MKLKTLKDLPYERIPRVFNPLALKEEWVNKKTLKQEAIKWVKDIETKKVKERSNRREGKNYNSNMASKQLVLIDFFNIIEEDLK